MRKIESVGVVGAGTMGLGIAQVCAANGFETFLFDVNRDQVDRALATIDSNLSKSLEKGRISDSEKTITLSRIHPVAKLAQLKVDLVIEAAIEKLDVKKELFVELEEVNSGNAILATNTSSISISAIAKALREPSVCIGLHFFNPADRMKLVEIISGETTHPAIVASIKSFALAIGKTAVVAKDSPGFIVNRVARHFYVESLKLMERNAADATTMDALLRSAGFRMGPFELMDLIGVDTNLAVTKSVYEGFGRAHKFAPNKIQQQLVDDGRCGRKSGGGFYDYAKT